MVSRTGIDKASALVAPDSQRMTRGPAGLSGIDVGRVSGLFCNAFEILARQHQAWRLGILNNDNRKEISALIQAYLQSEVTLDLSRQFGRDHFDDAFVQHVDSVVEEYNGATGS